MTKLLGLFVVSGSGSEFRIGRFTQANSELLVLLRYKSRDHSDGAEYDEDEVLVDAILKWRNI